MTIAVGIARFVSTPRITLIARNIVIAAPEPIVARKKYPVLHEQAR